MLAFQAQESGQTLAEGIGEYVTANPALADAGQMTAQAQQFFRCHDTVHVVYGCGTSLDDEAVVKIASLLGTTAGLGVLRGYRTRESIAIYRQLRPWEVLRSIVHGTTIVPRTIVRCLAQRERWPWAAYEQYLDVPLADLRRRFGITVAHAHRAPRVEPR